VNLLFRLFGDPATTGHALLQPGEYTTRYVEAKTPHTLLDVRIAEEFRSGSIPGAVNISLQDLPQKLKRVSTKKPVIIYCRSGNRSATAAKLLLQAGYTDVYDLGGIIEWTRQGLPIKR